MKIIVFHVKIFYELSLNNEIQMGFPLNGLEIFYVSLLYMCKPLKKVQKRISICFI